jgi:integrase
VARLFRALRGKRQRHVLLFVRLALYTSARTGAILDLTWDRVNFTAG